MKNTFKKEVTRVLIFFDIKEKVWYGVALDFGLVIDGDDPEVVRMELRNLILEFVETAKELHSEDLLNRGCEEEYEKIWEALEKGNLKRKILSPYQFYSVSKEYV